MFEDLIEKIKSNLEKVKEDNGLKNFNFLLKQDLEILKSLKQEDVAEILWYTPSNLQGVPSGLLQNVLSQILDNISSTLISMINNPYHPHRQNWVNSFVFNVRLLHTILNDFGFDIKYRKEIVKRGVSEVRKGIRQIEDLLKEVEAKKEKIDELTKEIEDIREELKAVEELYNKLNTINEELEQLKAKKGKIDEEYQEFLERKSIFENTLSDTEDLKKSLKELSEKLKEREGRFDEFLENAKETLEAFRRNQEKELTRQLEEGRKKLEELEKFKEQAKQTLRWTEVAGLKTAYEKRAEDLEIKAERAYKHFIWGVIGALAFAIVVIFGGEYLFRDDSFGFWLARLLLVVPALFVGWWLWNNYRETKLLADEYTHKKILAENLMIGVQTLKERLDVEGEEAKEKFLDPTLIKLLEDPIEKVYKLRVEEKKKIPLVKRIIQITRERNKNEEID